jgi:hypothetical protein
MASNIISGDAFDVVFPILPIEILIGNCFDAAMVETVHIDAITIRM